jgi:SAM-dependent methyltransferase
MSVLRRSWGAFTADRAARYLSGQGQSSPESREIVATVLSDLAGDREIEVLDLGCGNGGLAGYLQARKVPCRYTGVDFSEPLLEAARAANPGLTFIQDDVERLERVRSRFDAVLYSHVFEMLSSPQASLQRVSTIAPIALIRFFEPPDHEVDVVELREMDVGDGVVPYLRRSMSRDYYRLLLARAGCAKVEIYRCESARDQVHVLRFPWPRS